MATLENLLKEKCEINKKIIWPLLFKRCIDDGFGITKANKNEFELWVDEFNLLRETITIDKFKYGGRFYGSFNIFKGESLLQLEYSINLFSKKQKINICIFQLKMVRRNIPSKT